MQPRFGVAQRSSRPWGKICLQIGVVVLVGLLLWVRHSLSDTTLDSASQSSVEVVDVDNTESSGLKSNAGNNEDSSGRVEQLNNFLRGENGVEMDANLASETNSVEDKLDQEVDDVNTEDGASVKIEDQEASLDQAQEEEEDDEREMRELELAKRNDLWVEPKRLGVDEVCLRMFGNGYTNNVQICVGEQASMDCWYSPTSHGTMCEASNLILDPKLVKVAPGNENPANIKPRPEGDEIPVYKKGAWKQACKLPKEPWNPEYLAAHFKAITGALSGDQGQAVAHCKVWVEKPTLFITRYEHTDVYSTITDWYNTYQAQQQLADGEDVNLVFMDGHPKGPLDSAWSTMFGSNIRFLKSYKVPTCFRKAIFVPVGARSALSVTNFEELANCKRVPQVRSFANAFVRAMVKDDEQREALANPEPGSKPVVLVFLRNPDKPDHVSLVNEEEVKEMLNTLRSRADVRVDPFVGLSIQERIALARGSQVIVGMHDSALAYIAFGQPGATLIQMQLPDYQGFSYYSRISQFVGAAYRAISFPPLDDDKKFEAPVERLLHAISDAVPEDTGI